MFQEQAALVNIGPPPPHPIQPPTYAPKLRPGSTSSPITGPLYTYLKLLSLVPSFELPQVYAIMETITAEMMQQLGTSYPAQPTTPLRLGVQDPANPMFSDMLQIRREKDNRGGLPPNPRHPTPPHRGPSGNRPPPPPHTHHPRSTTPPTHAPHSPP